MVEVVYVCSPDYWRQLFLSIRSLYASESTFDSVRIYVTDNKQPDWNFNDPRIKVLPVPDIGGGFWMLNKTYLCDSEYDTVVFLDVDTLVIGNIDEVYRDRDVDLIARCAPRVETDHYDEEKWERRIAAYNCPGYPYLSSGFMVFQNHSHERIKQRWIGVTKHILNGESPDWHANQDAFSIACCAEGLTLGLMEKRDHAYAMIGEPPENSVVYHLGTPNYYYYYFKAQPHLSVGDNEAPVARPKFLLFQRLRNRLRRKINRTMGWSREVEPNWSRDS